MRPDRLRVAVPQNLLTLPPTGGHGKVWHRVLAGLGERTKVVPIDPATGRARPWRLQRAEVALCDGHDDLPPVRVPLVVQIHEAGWFDRELRETLDPSFHEFISTRTETAVRAASHVITPSESARRDVVAAYGLDPARVHAVPHGCDPTFRPDAGGGRALVARALGGRDAPYVLYAAALHPRKNLAALREAMAQLAADGLPHVLAVAGGPAVDRQDSADLERAAVAELPGAPNRVVRIQSPDDRALAGLMAEADAFCLPSLYEGFGLTVIEAMACGTPVVVSDRGSLPEVVGETGVVVPPTPTGITEGLRTLLAEPAAAERLGRAGLERAREFTWSRTSDGWIDVLRLAAAPGLDSPVR